MRKQYIQTKKVSTVTIDIAAKQYRSRSPKRSSGRSDVIQQYFLTAQSNVEE